MGLRKPNLDELRVINFLVDKAEKFRLSQDWQTSLCVRNMDDGGMGSLELFPKSELRENRIFGSNISEFQFEDADGIKVLVSLFVDQDGELYELDVWKTNFEKLIRFPENIS